MRVKTWDSRLCRRIPVICTVFYNPRLEGPDVPDRRVRTGACVPAGPETAGEEASAIAYIQIKHSDGKTRWGAGVDTNIELASIRAVLSALNRS